MISVRGGAFEAILRVRDAPEAAREVAPVFDRANDPQVVAGRRAALVVDVALDTGFRIFVKENAGFFVGSGDKTRNEKGAKEECFGLRHRGLGSK